jgi:hypothetical protein
MEEGSLSIIIVPESSANLSRWEPKEERAMPGDGTVVEKH